MKKFLCGVANLYAYDKLDNLLFSSKTMIKDAIEVTTANQVINAGQGNAQQYIYYHTSAMKITSENAQFDLNSIAANLGTSVITGTDVWATETVTLVAGSATIDGTPIATSSGVKYGWVEFDNGTTERVTFSTKTFTIADTTSTATVCVRYYKNDSSARLVTINANIIPSVVRLVLDAQLFSGDSAVSSTLIGNVQVEVPKAQLDGNQNIELSSSGVSSTPLTFMALATPVAGCNSSGVYATIKENVNSDNWYDNVIGLAIDGGDFSITHPATASTYLLGKVWAIPSSGAPFQPPFADLDFTSGTTAKATIGLHTGLITTVATGTTLITVKITNKTAIQTEATLTVA